MRVARSDSDSPRMRYAPVSSRVMGERNTRRPADARREPRAVPILPVVTPRQRIKHPRAAEYSRTHAQALPCGHTARCAERDCRLATCATCAPRTARVADYGGRPVPPLAVLEWTPPKR